jgi:hypothetical protein
VTDRTIARVVALLRESANALRPQGSLFEVSA